MWKIKTIHKRDDGGTAAIELESEDGSIDVNARWDGCMEIHLFKITEESRKLEDQIHTCDLKQLIKTLHSLNEVFPDFFDEGSYWEAGKQP